MDIKNTPEKLLKPYNPQETENRLYSAWEESGVFNPDVCIEKGYTAPDAEPFSIVLPPPNVTGTLHTGHALMLVIEDIMTRYARMQGKRTLWLPGTDHAAIATQSKVEKILEKEEGKRKTDLGREEFLKRVEKFAQDSHDTIVGQARRMGASLDWSREAFTLDEKRSFAVRTAFKKMFDEGLIYRGHRIVNWDPKGQTVISDDEIVYKEEKTKFYYLKYGPFTIGTARPETKFGDKYVVMHPDDTRYSQYNHGDKINVEWINGQIEATIIKDSMIDMEFGTGVMTITPWHSVADFELAEKHNLDKEQIIDKYGKLLPVAGEFSGIKIKDAREKIIEKLQQKGLVEKIEDYTHNIATAERTDAVIEPQVMNQWFINVNKPIPSHNGKTLKDLMLEPVKDGKIKIVPEQFERVYMHWIKNLRDWCISRQIWYGHRIPAYFDTTAPENETIHVYLKNKPLVLKNYNGEGFQNDIATEGSNNTVTSTSTKGLIELVEKGFTTWDEIREAVSFIETYGDQYKTEVFINSDEVPQHFIQDPDSLDTWFSSGLWTFSTLGWPEITEDFKTYHPTAVLETGYDILPFWVARMILMSTYLLNDIPFKTVYFHGLVRDEKGRKMSKSLGNIVDPITLIDKHGTDALRMAMIVGVGPGNDSNLGEDKIKAYSKFANKLWNITRFVLENTQEIDRENLPVLDTEDQQTADELDALLKEITGEMNEYKFYLVAEKLYHYAWHTFADVIIERSKTKIMEKNNSESAQRILIEILPKLLRALHPFMPFVTEELWSLIPEGKNGRMLIVEKWPCSL